MTAKRAVILKRIIEFYLESDEFNGIPHWQLHAEVGGNIEDINVLLEELLTEGEIVLSSGGNLNYKQYDDISRHEQLQALKNWQYAPLIIYPSEERLRDIIKHDYMDQPFTRAVSLGKPQLIPRFFEIEVLERYYQDPLFTVQNIDFWGAIREADPIDLADPGLLPSFGLAYRGSGERVLAVYLRLLSKMPAEHQQHWEEYHITEDCRIAYEYYQEAILGEQAEYRSIYEAFLAELRYINEMSMIMFNQRLFKNDHWDERPSQFRTIFRPARVNYIAFLRELGDLMLNNLNESFFKSVRLEGDKIIEPPGSIIAVFDKWLKGSIQIKCQEDFDLIFDPFKKISQVLNQPEEQIMAMEYSRQVFDLQNEWMVESYNALKMIRLLFANHPAVKDFEIPDWLFLGKVTIY